MFFIHLFREAWQAPRLRQSQDVVSEQRGRRQQAPASGPAEPDLPEGVVLREAL